MKKNYFLKKLIVICLSFFILLFIVPINYISADSQTYYEPYNDPIQFTYDTSNRQWYSIKTLSDSTRILFYIYNGNIGFVSVSLTSKSNDVQYYNPYVSGWQNWSTNNQDHTSDGVIFYTRWTTINNASNKSSDINVAITTSSINQTFVDNIYYYSFGDGSVGPSPVIDFGSLKVGYNTDFVSNGFAVDGWNRDNISWSLYDTNNNLLDDLNYTIELRAIPGYYTDVSSTQLLLQSYTNWISGYAMQLTNGAVNLEPFEYYTLYRGSPGIKNVSYTWAEVVNHFDMTVDTLKVMSAGTAYYKAGWRYEIRYIKGDLENPDYTSPWQIIYQVTAVAPQTSENIYNELPNGLSPELYNLLQTVNTLNNTVQNWNINGVPINMQPNQTVNPDNSWIEILVSSISDLLGKLIEGITAIVEAIIGLGGDIIEGLFSIVSDSISAIINFFNNLWDSFTNLFNGFDFTNHNSDYDIETPDINSDLPEGETLYDIIPAFVRMINNSGLGFFLWMPLIIGIIYIVL